MHIGIYAQNFQEKSDSVVPLIGLKSLQCLIRFGENFRSSYYVFYRLTVFVSDIKDILKCFPRQKPPRTKIFFRLLFLFPAFFFLVN